MTIRVLLADDHAMMRDGIKAILAGDRGISIVAEAGNGRDAVRLAQDLMPDVVVMDISMPDLNGIEAIGLIREKCPLSRILVLSMQSDSEYVFRAIKAGAAGYLVKVSAGDEMNVAIRAVHAGRRYLAQSLASLANQRFLIASTESPLESLSSRERCVLQLVVEGHSSAEIASCLSLSAKTIDTYRGRLMRKLGVREVTELVKFAVEHGITT